jgi:hypothetical protein
LDALEALHPGELARIVTEAVTGYRDDVTDDLWHAEHEAQRRAEMELNAMIGDLPGEVASIRHAAYDAHRRLMAATKADRDAYRAQVAPLQERLNELAATYNEAVADLDVALPDRPTPMAPAIAEGGDEDWLYRSDRTYMEQLRRYRWANQ